MQCAKSLLVHDLRLVVHCMMVQCTYVVRSLRYQVSGVPVRKHVIACHCMNIMEKVHTYVRMCSDCLCFVLHTCVCT